MAAPPLFALAAGVDVRVRARGQRSARELEAREERGSARRPEKTRAVLATVVAPLRAAVAVAAVMPVVATLPVGVVAAAADLVENKIGLRRVGPNRGSMFGAISGL